VALATILNSMLQKSRRKLIFASMRSNALVAWAFASDRVEYEDGGYQIGNPLTVGRNPNVASYEYYDQLPVAQTNEFITVNYFWSRVAGTVIISDQEEDENKGEAMIFKLLKAKMDVLEESIKEKFSDYLYAAGGGTDPLGLASLIPDDPTTGTLGGVNRATETQWRTSSYNFAGAINSKYLRLHMLKGVNMKVKSLSAPWDTDASGSRIVWQGQWCLWRAYRTHGVLNN